MPTLGPRQDTEQVGNCLQAFSCVNKVPEGSKSLVHVAFTTRCGIYKFVVTY